MANINERHNENEVEALAEDIAKKTGGKLVKRPATPNGVRVFLVDTGGIEYRFVLGEYSSGGRELVVGFTEKDLPSPDGRSDEYMELYNGKLRYADILEIGESLPLHAWNTDPKSAMALAAEGGDEEDGDEKQYGERLQEARDELSRAVEGGGEEALDRKYLELREEDSVSNDDLSGLYFEVQEKANSEAELGEGDLDIPFEDSKWAAEEEDWIAERRKDEAHKAKYATLAEKDHAIAGMLLAKKQREAAQRAPRRPASAGIKKSGMGGLPGVVIRRG